MRRGPPPPDAITEAAEVSESTLYRFFPAKRDLVLSDDLDPAFVAAFEAQPAGLGTIEAIRAALRTVLADLPEAEIAERRQLPALVLAVPELRSALVDQLTGAATLLADAVARRTGRAADSTEVRTLAGAVLGVAMVVLVSIEGDPGADVFARVDESWALLAEGFPF
ncbi:TetR family transcriptional regulator [Embleya sp. NBC_00896]|uniref:acyl-CoA-like ligand-binding transcription factor n=1 Tax=Embleya sp. NBC_00896 TaxID=2975961 RepID=UPI0038665FA4|nr:TetR family transcriptional regulator [Embleya sp. NBC_00896]